MKHYFRSFYPYFAQWNYAETSKHFIFTEHVVSKEPSTKELELMLDD